MQVAKSPDGQEVEANCDPQVGTQVGSTFTAAVFEQDATCPVGHVHFDAIVPQVMLAAPQIGVLIPSFQTLDVVLY